MSPHPDDFDDFLVLKDLIDQTVLNVDASRVGTGKVTYQLLKGGRRLERILSENFQESFSLDVFGLTCALLRFLELG